MLKLPLDMPQPHGDPPLAPYASGATTVASDLGDVLLQTLIHASYDASGKAIATPRPPRDGMMVSVRQDGSLRPLPRILLKPSQDGSEIIRTEVRYAGDKRSSDPTDATHPGFSKRLAWTLSYALAAMASEDQSIYVPDPEPQTDGGSEEDE